MTKTIRILTLLALMVIGAGQAWAKTKPDLGKIVYTQTDNDHGTLSFYADEACQTAISNPGNGLNSKDLTSVKDGSDVIGYKVYIKATPDFGYTLEAADNEGKVSFITAEVTVAGTDVAGARTRGAAPTVNVGDFIDVTATETEGVYCVTMPADKNLNLHITATFPERPYLTGVSYIDPTKTGNAQNATTPDGTHVYILDGTETVLGSDDDTPTWYVVNGDVNFNHAFEINKDVRIILANGKTMNIGSETSCLTNYGVALRPYSQLTIYGQGGSEEGSLNIYSNQTSFYSTHSGNAITICGGHVVTNNNINFANGKVNIQGGRFTDKDEFIESAIPYSIRASEIMIDGGAVSAKGLLFAETNGITVNGGSVDVYQFVADKGNITLGWKNGETDYIATTNGYQCNDGNLTFATGKRFYAYAGENVAAVYDAQTVLTKDETYKTYPELVGKVLKPCDGNFVKLIDGVTASATDGESVTIGTDTWYKVASDAEVTLRATDSDKKLGSVTLTGATATGSDGTFTFTMPTSDVTVTAAAFLEQVTYYDPTAEGDNKTKTVFATPLTGSETTLDAGWYVVNKDVYYTTVTGNIVLNATGDVNLILADDKTMNIGSEGNPVTGRGINFNSTAALAIYGQGGTTEGSLKIYTGTTYSIQGKVDITIYGGNLTVGRTLSTDGKFTIHGGTFTDARTTNDNDATAINAAEINIHGGRVTSVGKLYGNHLMGTGDINISGGIVDVRCLSAYNGSIAISGGQVTLTIANNHAINGKNGITLGWTNVTDFISVKGEGHFHSDGDLTISEGKGFLAISGDNSIAYYDSNSKFTKDKYGNFSDLTGKTLRPALKISLPAGFTATGTDVVTHETAGTYAIDGATVTINSNNSVPEGYTLSFTVKDADNNEVSVTNGKFTMPATDVTVTATQTAIPATAPSITAQPAGLSLLYGYPSGSTLSVTASAADGHALSYQWYSSSSPSASGTAISGATAASYDVPTGLSVGSTYYYCVVTATRSDNSETATATSSVATVTVSARTVESASGVTITQDEGGYTATINEESGDAAVISSSILNSNGKVTIASLTYNRTLTAPTGTGEVTIDNQAANLYTTCMPTAPTTDGGKKYYSLSGADDTTLSFTEVAQPAAYTPYLVAVFAGSNATESSSGTDITLSKEVSASSSADGYVLKGTLTGLSNTEAQGKYILQSGGTWGRVVSGSVIISPFRAYIEATGAGARLLESSFGDDATGIRSMRTIDRDGTERWYDLQGRRIDKPVQQGVYIHNGRKEVRR